MLFRSSANIGRAEIAERIELMTGLAISKGFPDPDNFAVRALAQEIRRQALVMSFADAFLILSFLFLIFSIVPVFLQKPGSFSEPAPSEN